jgi:hypothetical protein
MSFIHPKLKPINNIILFTALYYNDNVTDLLVSPSVGVYPMFLP